MVWKAFEVSFFLFLFSKGLHKQYWINKGLLDIFTREYLIYLSCVFWSVYIWNENSFVFSLFDIIPVEGLEEGMCSYVFGIVYLSFIIIEASYSVFGIFLEYVF